MDVKNNPWFKLSLFLIYHFSFNSCLFLGAEKISANESLSGNHTIVSAGGVFELGFFKPGNSSNFYIGIWYKEVSPQTVVWVANREIPVSDAYSSELRILDGNLVLFNEFNVPIWSTNLSSTSSGSVEAQLHDDGNLVLRYGSNNSSSELLWESFDHPTDTWLPGAKLGYNKITRRNILLTSWKNRNDPAPGLFSFQLEPTQRQFHIFHNRITPFYSSGSWDGHIFTGVPDMRLNYIYNYSYVNNDNESYFIYFQYNSSIRTRCLMDVRGQIQQQLFLEPAKQWNLFWTIPRMQCEVYAYCGAFGSCNERAQPFCHCLTGFVPRLEDDWNSSIFSGGCVRRSSLQCGNSSLAIANGQSDRFLPNYGLNMPKNALRVEVANGQECESACFRNCSCTAYAYDSNQCSILLGDVLDLRQADSGRRTLYIKLAASEFPSSSNNNGTVIRAVVGSVLAVTLLGLFLLAILIRRRNRRIKIGKAMEGSLVAFGYKDLQSVTKNFSERLGRGGFGSVFKGMLPDSSFIAVKKLESISQGEKQFRTEVRTIGTIQHVNLVRLRGFCSEDTKMLLVYDYMPNGSLDNHLFHDKDPKILDWKTRYSIALGTARGLTYLHEKCRDCILHCDIKPENILLDAEFCPKVADFGLAKLVGREFSRVLTTMRGTRGYLAPEWMSGVAITAKTDVYSYGMMLFEFVSGRRNTEQSEDRKVKFFPTWVVTQIGKGTDLLNILDPRLEGDADEEQLARICKVAGWCVQDNETQRPSMGQVVKILEGVLDVNPPPIPRSLQVYGDNEEHIIFFTESLSGQGSQPHSNASNASSQSNCSASSASSNTKP